MYSMQDLCEQFSLSRHAVYKYIKIGALPRPKGHGITSYYTDEHVRLLRRIRDEVHDRSRLTDLAERRMYESGQQRA